MRRRKYARLAATKINVFPRHFDSVRSGFKDLANSAPKTITTKVPKGRMNRLERAVGHCSRLSTQWDWRIQDVLRHYVQNTLCGTI